MSQPPRGEVKLYPLQSTHLDRIGYDPDAQAMHVIFKDGSHHVYHNVTGTEFSRLLTADSPGSHFHTHIKPNHRATRIQS
jgi:hypothetical protein